MTDDVYFTKNTRPICLPRAEYQDNLGESGMIAGWGFDGRSWSNNLFKSNKCIHTKKSRLQGHDGHSRQTGLARKRWP